MTNRIVRVALERDERKLAAYPHVERVVQEQVRQDLEFLSLRKIRAIRQNKLHMVRERAFGDGALIRSKRMSGRCDENHLHAQQALTDKLGPL